MKVLIVVDMLNGFCRKGYPLSLQGSTKKIEQYIAKRIIEINRQKGKVIFMCDRHSPSDPEIGRPYPPHCMAGTVEADIIDELKPFSEKSIVLTKNTLSVFLNTGLEKVLRKIKPTEVEITGVCTDICDLFAVYEFRIRGYNVTVSSKGVMSLVQRKQKEFLAYYRDKLGADVQL